MTSILDTKSPLLWRACLAGEVPIMEKVMGQGVDPTKRDRNGENCLHMCARSGEVDAFQRMIREGLDPDTPNHNGQTPLHIAVSKGHISMLRHIVRNGGNTDLKSKFSGMTALHLSCVEGETDMAEFLLDNGANCAIQDSIGKYADDYTHDDAILGAFSSHFPVCTHGRRADKGYTASKQALSKTTSQVTAAVIVNSTDEDRSREIENSRSRVENKKNEKDEMDENMDDDDEDDDDHKTKSRRKMRKRSPKRERGVLADREGKQIYDKMEHYDVDRARGNWDKAKQGGRKVKVNHSLGFSDEHKQRMAQNVFDRLMGGKKK